MGTFSIWHWLIVLLIVVMVFGTKKLKNLGSDLGGAVKGFKDGMKEGGQAADTPAGQAPQQVDGGLAWRWGSACGHGARLQSKKGRSLRAAPRHAAIKVGCRCSGRAQGPAGRAVNSCIAATPCTGGRCGRCRASASPCSS